MILDRKTYLGGADVASILGVSPWMSPFMLYQKKIGAFIEEITPAKQKIFDRGHRWEPIVVEMMVDELRERGHDVEIIARNARYQDSEYPFLAAEIDVELMIDGEEVNGEAKTVSPFALKDWGDENSDEIPIYYAAQVMHGLMIKPRRKAILAALTGFDDKPRIHWIERDEEIITGIRAREIAFWQRIIDRNAPDPETVEDVKWLYRTDNGSVIEADYDLAFLCNKLRNLKEDAKNLDSNIELLATQIKAAMGDAATLLYRGKTIATWKNNKNSLTTDWKAAYLDMEPVPGHIQNFIGTKPGNRPFILK